VNFSPFSHTASPSAIAIALDDETVAAAKCNEKKESQFEDKGRTSEHIIREKEKSFETEK
jgi:hypothetical protein